MDYVAGNLISSKTSGLNEMERPFPKTPCLSHANAGHVRTQTGSGEAVLGRPLESTKCFGS